MLTLAPVRADDGPLRLLCLGAHSDDLEIGCAGTVMTWLESSRPIHVTWVVLTGGPERSREARRSAKALLRRAAAVDLVCGEFRDGFLPAQYEQVKAFLEAVKVRAAPDIVFTHRLEDRHQDHRLVGELTWNTWRDHLVIEYEIAKYEGDLGQPNLFLPMSAAIARRKSAHLERHFGSQRSKDWFSQESFMALAKLRGIECRSPSGYAEAFHARKLTLAGRVG
jgi:LmbE family N-acetylglucosaminyl deacetylase